jgi:predicted ester cyclase
VATNKEIAIDLSLAIMRGDWDRVESLLAEDFEYTSDGRAPLNKVSYLAFTRYVLCEAMTEMQMSFPRSVEEGELVALEYQNAMTHSGLFLGHSGTGRRVIATGHLIRQVRDGKVRREWQTTNAAGLLAQLGAPRSY